MTGASPGARRFYLVYVRTDAELRARLVLRTRSGPAAIAAAEPIGGWVEGDDHSYVWPCSGAEGPGWYWATLRSYDER